jgi:hypothetical protein
MIRMVELQFWELDFTRAHKVDFLNASKTVFRGCGFCWMSRHLRNGDPRPWSGSANMPRWNRDTSRWLKS